MQIRILTLPFSAVLGGFDETALAELCHDRKVLRFREHLFSFEGQPYMTCVVTSAARGETASIATREASPHELPSTPPPNRGDATSPGSSRAATARTPERQAAFERIRAWRRARAEAEGVPPYVLLTNRELGAIVDMMPESRSELGSIQGIGPAKLRRYGNDLLALLADRPIEHSAASEGPAVATEAEAQA